jgi:hypothetical protein
MLGPAKKYNFALPDLQSGSFGKVGISNSDQLRKIITEFDLPAGFKILWLFNIRITNPNELDEAISST